MNLDWTMITGIAAAVACVGMALVVILWLCGKISSDRVTQVWRWVCWLVQAAEQLFGAKTGQQKHDYVVDMLKQLGIKVTDQIDALIEAAVRELTD